MAVRHFVCRAGLCCLCALGPVGLAAAGDHAAAGPVAAQVGTGAMQAALAELLAKAFRPHSRRKPEWVQRQPEVELDAELHSIGRESWQLVLQQERRDGAELLTLRLPLADSGALRTYAGADLRWIELGDRAVALQSEGGLVSADPLMLGLSLGCRF